MNRPRFTWRMGAGGRGRWSPHGRRWAVRPSRPHGIHDLSKNPVFARNIFPKTGFFIALTFEPRFRLTRCQRHVGIERRAPNAAGRRRTQRSAPGYAPFAHPSCFVGIKAVECRDIVRPFHMDQPSKARWRAVPAHHRESLAASSGMRVTIGSQQPLKLSPRRRDDLAEHPYIDPWFPIFCREIVERLESLLQQHPTSSDADLAGLVSPLLTTNSTQA